MSVSSTRVNSGVFGYTTRVNTELDSASPYRQQTLVHAMYDYLEACVGQDGVAWSSNWVPILDAQGDVVTLYLEIGFTTPEHQFLFELAWSGYVTSGPGEPCVE